MLVGSSWATREALRPLAYSMLAELVHHLRTELTLAQIKTVIHIFSRCWLGGRGVTCRFATWYHGRRIMVDTQRIQGWCCSDVTDSLV